MGHLSNDPLAWPWWAVTIFVVEDILLVLMAYLVYRLLGPGRVDRHLRIRQHEHNYRMRVWTRETLAEVLDEADRFWSDPLLRRAEHQVALRIASDRNTAPTLRVVPSVSSDPRDGYELGDPKRLAFEGKLL